MKFYIHISDYSKNLKQLIPAFVECDYFQNFDDLNFEELDAVVNNVIFCVDSTFIKDQIISKYKNNLTVSYEYLSCQLKQYYNLISRLSLYVLLKNTTVYFSGFPDHELLELQFRVIMMGGSVVTNCTEDEFEHVTHVIPFQMTEEHKLESERFLANPKHIVTSNWVTFFWEESFKITDSREKLKNFYLQEVFEARFLFNVNICLLGFDKEQGSTLMGAIVSNHGSVTALSFVHEANCIVVPVDFIPANFSMELSKIPRHMHNKIVYQNWLIDCVRENCVKNLDHYQVFPLVEDQPGNNALTDSLVDKSHLKPISRQLSDRKTISVLQKYLSEEIEDKEYLKEGYNSSEYSTEKIENFDGKRHYCLTDLKFFLSNKKIVFKDFLDLQQKCLGHAELTKFFQVFGKLLEFLDSFYSILQPVNDNYDRDFGFAAEFLLHYAKVKSFILFDKHLIRMVETFDRLEKESPLVMEHFKKFSAHHKLNNIKNFLFQSKSMLMSMKTYLIGINGETSRTHPDFFFQLHLNKKFDKTIHQLNDIEENFVSGKQRILLMKLIGISDTFEFSNTYLTVFDCMQFYEDGLKYPKTVFVFKDTLVVCRLKNSSAVEKRYNRFLSQMKKYDEKSVEGGQISRSSSIQSINSQSPYSTVSSRRNEPAFCELVGGDFKNKLQRSKIHKLFTGLSKLSWTNISENSYDDKEDISLADIISISSMTKDSTMAGHMFIRIKFIDRRNGVQRNLVMQIVPRIVDKLSKYEKMKTVLPENVEWSFDKGIQPNFRWERFIVDEKQALCNLLAVHSKTTFFEESISYSESITDNQSCTNESVFKTPLRSRHFVRHFLSSKKGSPTQSLASSTSRRTDIIPVKLRRLTKFFSKRKSSALDKPVPQTPMFDHEDEPSVMHDFHRNIPNSMESPMSFAMRGIKKHRSNDSFENKENESNY